MSLWRLRKDLNIATELNEAIKLRGMKFIHQNIRSIRGKLDELNILISQCLNLHILAFTETWLDNGITDGEISLPGYKIFRSDRPNGKGGGIAVYVKEFLSIIRRVDLEQQFPGECILLEILLPKANGILFGTFYRPPILTREFSGDNFTDQKLCLLPVTESFVFKQLKGLKVKKATGLDRIPACLLKDSAAVITQSITLLVNLSLSTGIVPDEWKQARVVPLHKSGGREVMDNYRPISILPVISKIAEKAVNVQLQQYLTQHGLLNSFQSGFRRYHSTQTAVTYFCDTIRRSTDAGKLTGALFIDLKKAFDTVPHDDLICKLKRFGMEENSLAWLTSYLTNRSQAVCVEDELSSPMPVFSGVPQGSILGPVLFILYINDLPSCIQFSNIMMYADDTVIYLSSTTTLDIELKLNLDLVNLSQWLHHNKLVLNMKKTEFMTFGTRQRLAKQKCDETDISLNGQSIKHTDTFKYLGVVLDDTLSFNDHVDYVRTKVSKILGMFSRIRPSLTLEAANRLYKAMVLPVLDYCDAVWHECGQGNSDKMERLQRRAARIIYYKAASNLSTDQIMIKLGLEPTIEDGHTF